ncbi:MarR family transcriptional regulator [Kineococcus sp. NBC_00420]|uniref:MarR family winged helix-turn-helix transcriptional regulator n=1 Tax=unclassified Kineococcus TaxID=2621656 RepID=UPI002E206C02
MARANDRADTLFAPGRRARVLQLLRAYTDTHVELTRHLARALGVHGSDAVAVAEVLWAEASGTPLTPARLAERIGLTSGATASLLNRLEDAGMVVRNREDTDRRIIRLRLTPAARAATTAFFESTGHALDDVLDDYDDAALQQVERLLTGVVAATEAHNERLRATGSGVGERRSS